jgi:prolyl-tRNA synthetase
MVWPFEVSPFQIHLIDLDNKEISEKIYDILQNENYEVLYDDREDKTAGEKFNDCDLIGIPLRIVVSKKTGEDKVEIKKRNEEKIELINIKDLIKNVERFFK